MSLQDVEQRVVNDGRAGTPQPRLALQRKEAAEALGIGVDTFDRHVRAALPVVYVGSVRLYPLAGLERWLASNANGTIDSTTRWGGAARTARPRH
jgi:hypothetical protein